MRSFGARLAVALVAAIAGSGFIAAGAAVPITAAHFVSHRVHDHTSILQFIERRFGLPALTQRDAHANPMLARVPPHPAFTGYSPDFRGGEFARQATAWNSSRMS